MANVSIAGPVLLLLPWLRLLLSKKINACMIDILTAIASLHGEFSEAFISSDMFASQPECAKSYSLLLGSDDVSYLSGTHLRGYHC